MKLKTKSLLVVGFVMFLFLVLLLTTIRPIVLEGAKKLDENQVQKELDTIYNHLLADMDMIKRTNLDWAVWDDTYYFIDGKYQSYPEVNLQDLTFVNTKLNYMIFLDKDNKLVYQDGYDFNNNSSLKLTEDFYKDFLPIVNSKSSERSRILITDYGMTITSAEPVFLSNHEGESVGTLIVGKILDKSVVMEIGKSLSLQLSMREVELPKLVRNKIEVIDENSIKGALFLKDFTKEETYELSFIEERDHYTQKKSSVNQLSFYLLITCISMIIVILVLLNRLIVSRIAKLSFQLKGIQENQEVKSRIRVNNGQKDELSNLEVSINQMLASLEEKHDEVAQLAYYDSLTLLPNRFYLEKYFFEFISQKQNSKAVLFLDLDGFKRVNDSLGHDIGDKLLVSVTERINPIISKHFGIISRFGGDEFVILMCFDEKEGLRRVVNQILIEVGKESHLRKYRTMVTASIGISIYKSDSTSLEELLQKADIAMYEAKRKGKNQFHFYEDLAKDSNYKDILELENDLKFALKKNQFQLYYQPIICSVTKRILGVEALLRWNHPTKGMISPVKFIPIAEETGLMPLIGEWVLVESIKQISYLHQKGYNNLTLSINVSKSQMKDSHFIKMIDEVLTKYNYPASRLQIEITESDIGSFFNDILTFTTELKKRNVLVALDDFGVGTSSLLFLRELPIDIIKIDRGFIRNVPWDSFDTTLLTGILDIMKGLDIELVIEGIEHEEQFNYITSLIESKIQGYYFSKPLAYTDLITKYFSIEQ
ncbi:bifunctional diguanylate cyclase/phosphodiesterase [Metabacillus malikii]|uniref:Diguanylate cyclase (GGDEF)-like protein n=1 Tax=Metabacillus malikii TaxID=1504265 RepID=A0ABT9ZNV0_9BACI|nr:EAL domain-containing protein [Metabacillus malikii]MDQ0233655.1 diguanylate cyclase (GGDEF)-like protein [Metabacillus malikii]